MAENNKNDFQIAGEISDLLKDVSEKERRERILRWVSESLGLAAERAAASTTATTNTAAASTSGAPTTLNRASNIKTFMDEKQPRSDQQFAVATAYYYRFEAPPAERLDAITADVLQNATRLAGRDRLSRPRQVLSNAKRQGYLDTSERGAYAINTVGENLVAMSLPGSGGQSSKKTRKSKKTKKEKRSISSSSRSTSSST